MPELPPANVKRWTPQRKAAVLAAVRSGAITVEEACRRYEISGEEFLAWLRRSRPTGFAVCAPLALGNIVTVRLREVAEGDPEQDDDRCPCREATVADFPLSAPLPAQSEPPPSKGLRALDRERYTWIYIAAAQS